MADERNVSYPLESIIKVEPEEFQDAVLNLSSRIAADNVLRFRANM